MPGFSERIFAAPANPDRLPEEKPTIRERVFGRKEDKNRRSANTYEYYLEEAKRRHREMTLEQVEAARAHHAEHTVTPEEQPEPEAIPQSSAHAEFPWDSEQEDPRIDFDEIESSCHFLADAHSIESAHVMASEDNALQMESLGADYVLGNEIRVEEVTVAGKPYKIQVHIHELRPVAGAASSDRLVPIYVIRDVPAANTTEDNNSDTVSAPDPEADRVQELMERAESDALDYTYAKRLAEAARDGRELSVEQRKFILDNMVEMGLNSAMADLVAQENGFASFQQAARELRAESGIYHGEQFIKEPEKLMDKLPPSVQNALKSAKFGAVTTGALALLALAAPVLVPTAVAAAGGLVGSTVARGLVGHFTRDRAIFGKIKGGPVSKEQIEEQIEILEDQGSENIKNRIKTIKEGESSEEEKQRAYIRLLKREHVMPKNPDRASTAEQTFQDMIAKFHAGSEAAREGMGAVEDAELTAKERDLAYAKLLNEVVDTKLQGSVESVEVYRDKIKGARRSEAIASAIGGALGGFGASLAHSHIDALRNGIQLREHTMQYIRGDWHYQLNAEDIAKGIEHHQNMLDLHPGMNPADTHTLTYFNGDQASGFSDLNSSLSEVQQNNAFHINAEKWSQGAPKIIEGMYTPDVTKAIWLRSVMPGIYGASLAFLTGEWAGIAKARREKDLEAKGAKGLASLYSNKREVRDFKLPNAPSATEQVPTTPQPEVTTPRPETQPQGQEFANLKDDQALRIRNSVQNIILRGQGMELEKIRKITEGEEVQNVARECPKNITELLGFQPGEISKEDLILMLPDALNCAIDKTVDISRYNITDDQAYRLEALQAGLGQLQAAVSGEDRFAPTVASVRDHLLFVRKEPSYRARINQILSDNTINTQDILNVGGLMNWIAYRDDTRPLDLARREKYGMEEAKTVLTLKAQQYPSGSPERTRLEEAAATIGTMLTMIDELHPGMNQQNNQRRNRNRQNQNAGQGRNP